MRLLPLVLFAACVSNPFAPAPLPAEGLQLELVRYAGRMTVLAWVDTEQNLLFKTRLNRPNFKLPVRYTKAQEFYEELKKRDPENADRLFAEQRAGVDEDYLREVEIEFEKFWKTGPFATPKDIDTKFALEERIQEAGVHELHIAVEPDTVSWSVTFRLTRDGKTLVSYDFDSEMHMTLSGDRLRAPPIRIRR